MKHSDKKKTIISITIITMILGIIITRMSYTHQITANLISDKTSEVATPSVTPAQSNKKVIQNSSNKEIEKADTNDVLPISSPEKAQSKNEAAELNTSTFTNENIQNNTSNHTHNWIPQYTTVHHDAQYNSVHHDVTGHYETQTVNEGYYSEEPVYTEGYVTTCFGCGKTTGDFGGDFDAFFSHVAEEGSRYGGVWKKVQTGTHQVWHDPVTEQVWIENSPAYDEQVKVSDAYDEQIVSGYTCSSCGAIQ